MAEACVPLDCHIREPDPQLVSYALRVRNVPQAVSVDVLRELFDQVRPWDILRFTYDRQLLPGPPPLVHQSP